MTTNQGMTAFGLSAALVAFSTAATAHPPEASGAHHDVPTRAWHDARQGVEYQGSLMAVRADGVTLQLDDGAIVSIPMVDLDPDDRTQAESKLTAVRSLNKAVFAPPAATATAPKLPNTTAPWQAASFAPFAPFVRTHADAQWLYVESDGLPHAPVDFTMMVGIRAWQQQVPIPQAYTGDNAWQIPLRPAFAEIPISGKNGLRRGAIALAANGIPIFNAYNNRGEDSFAIGELDDFGGHCGRADDYHYHAAPLALQKAVGAKTHLRLRSMDSPSMVCLIRRRRLARIARVRSVQQRRLTSGTGMNAQFLPAKALMVERVRTTITQARRIRTSTEACAARSPSLPMAKKSIHRHMQHRSGRRCRRCAEPASLVSSRQVRKHGRSRIRSRGEHHGLITRSMNRAR